MALAAIPGSGSVVLLEKEMVSHGASWHAAGLLNQLRGTRLYTRMYSESADVYDTIEATTGQATGFRRVGSLRLASNEQRWAEFKDDVPRSISYGVEAHLIS